MFGDQILYGVDTSYVDRSLEYRKDGSSKSLDEIKEETDSILNRLTGDREYRNFGPYINDALQKLHPDAGFAVTGAIWNLSLCFFYDEQANIITSDNPMYYEYENEKISFILFPVSSELVLMMYKSEHGHRNILRPITDSQRKLIFEIMVKQAKQMIFLKRSINKQEIKLANKILDENKLSSL